jgi:hypothetical protein
MGHMMSVITIKIQMILMISWVLFKIFIIPYTPERDVG